MAKLENIDPMAFCDGCLFRNRQIAPGVVCARSALDNVHSIFGMIALNNAEVPGDNSSIEESNKGAESTFASMFEQDVLVCIESVSNGGNPIIVSDSF